MGLSVRGQLRSMVMPADAYQRLRDCELEIALQETRADLATGHVHASTVDDHLRRLRHHQTAPGQVRFHVRKESSHGHGVCHGSPQAVVCADR